MKKATSVLLTICLVLSILTAPVVSGSAADRAAAATGYTDGDYRYELLRDNTVCITAYYEKVGTEMTIPAVLGGYQVSGIGDGVFVACGQMERIVLPDTLTYIGERAFQYCSALTEISIASSKPLTIDDRAFLECKALRSVSVKGGIKAVGESAFRDCTNLRSVADTGALESIGYRAFSGCMRLTDIRIPDSLAEIRSEAFNDSGWMENQPNGVVYAGRIAYCYKGACPSSVTLRDGTVGIAPEAFAGCTGLKKITIPDSVTRIGTDALADTAWYSAQPNGIVYAGKVAYGCKGDCPAQVVLRADTVGIAENAFSDCRALTTIDIPDSVSDIGDAAFDGCSSLIAVRIPNGVQRLGTFAFCGCSDLEEVQLPDSLKVIGDQAFNGCRSLCDITIPNSVTDIEYHAFIRCGLRRVTIPRGVKRIESQAFGYKDLNDPITDFVVCGYAGTEAQRYAEENGFDFETPTVTLVRGDINNDGTVNNRDAIVLDRFVAGWVGYDRLISDPDAADLNVDGRINNRDTMILDRYVAGWQGYEQYLIA